MNCIKLENRHRPVLIAGVVLLTIYYAYFWLGKLYHSDGALSVFWRVGIITVGYVFLILVILWKNSLSAKTNHLLSWIFFCAAPFVSFLSLELVLTKVLVLKVGHTSHSILMNLLIYVSVLLVLYLVSSRIKRAVIVSYIFFAFLALGMYYVMIFRGTALILADFLSIQTAANVAGGYDFNLDFMAYLGTWLPIGGIVIISKLHTPRPFPWKIRLVMAAAALVICASFVPVYLHSEMMSKYKVRLWRPQDSYAKYGAVLALVESGRYLVVKKPENYSAAAVEEIAATYRKQADDTSSDVKPNIIVIMDEALCDLQSLGESGEVFRTNKEVLPFINGLKENTIKSNLFVSNLGGGTAIMEFEMLTGNTNAFLPKSTIAYQTIIKDRQPSFVSHLSALGYQGMYAIHPYRSNSYYRDKAYPYLGFKEFIDETQFIDPKEDKNIGANISDQVAFDKIIEKYEEAKERSSAPFFAFEVTMQNHTPFEEVENPEITILDDGYADSVAERYVNYAHASDQAFQGLVSYFEKVNEPTVLCIFGDHPPAIKTGFYSKVFGKKESALSAEETMKLRKTPVVIWANYQIEGKTLQAVSPNYISGLVSDAAGIKKSGYQRFLQELQKKVPVINGIGYWGADGNYYETDDQNSPYYDIVHQYHILEYNNLIDRKNRIENFFE